MSTALYYDQTFSAPTSVVRKKTTLKNDKCCLNIYISLKIATELHAGKTAHVSLNLARAELNLGVHSLL